jgi:hypothetical protein
LALGLPIASANPGRKQPMKLKYALMAGALACGISVTPMMGQNPDQDKGVKDDVKDAGKATGRAAKKTGRKIKKGTKKGVNKAAEGTEKGADKVRQKTEP